MASPLPAMIKNPPNILYLHSHDTGRYIRPYGHDLPTPNLQKLAEEGVLFRQAYCANPTCSPSRAALLTGQYPHNNGMTGLTHRGFGLNNPRHHLATFLRNLGYRTLLSGIQHEFHADPGEGSDATALGYERILDSPGNNHADGKMICRATETFFSRESAAIKQPFFLSVGFAETHRKFPPHDPEDDPRYCLPPAPLPDSPETRFDMACYKTCVRRLDEYMGRILKALENSGQAENTWVICTTDHGIPFPSMKCSLTDPGIGVMLIMRGPGGFQGGRVIDALVSQIDIHPTICDLLEVEQPTRLQGASLMPLIRKEKEGIREEIFAEVNFHAACEPKRCIRTRRWKYIRRFHERDFPVLPNCDAGPSKDYWLAHGWAVRPQPEERLYDLVFDPQERENLADNPEFASVKTDLKERLHNWMRETRDPLLQGPLSPPKGARITPADARDP